MRGPGQESDREDTESSSQLGLAGSIVSRRLEVHAQVSASPKRSTFVAGETTSATVSLSEKSTTLSMADDGAASTRALAGSLLSYKMEDSSSVSSYRIPGAGHTSASASGSVKSGYAPIEVHQVDGDGRSSSPVSYVSLSGDEVTPAGVALRRSARRTRFTVDPHHNAPSSSVETELVPSVTASGEDHNSHVIEHVRFDDHVSYIDRVVPVVDDVTSRTPQTETFTS